MLPIIALSLKEIKYNSLILSSPCIFIALPYHVFILIAIPLLLLPKNDPLLGGIGIGETPHSGVETTMNRYNKEDATLAHALQTLILELEHQVHAFSFLILIIQLKQKWNQTKQFFDKNCMHNRFPNCSFAQLYLKVSFFAGPDSFRCC